MAESFKQMKLVSADILQGRMDSVKDLKQEEHEAYDIMKDLSTGEHYLHYAYKHIDITQNGEEELYHYLMPIDHDDVLAIILGEQAFTYPDHWQDAFLRNGPDGDYVWFDPGEVSGDQDDHEIGQLMAEKLLKLKQRDGVDENAVRQFFDELDTLFKDKDKE
jgi:hypothetical protein